MLLKTPISGVERSLKRSKNFKGGGCQHLKHLVNMYATSQREFDYGGLKKHGPAELFSATFFCTCLLSIDLFCRTFSFWPRLWSKQFPAASDTSHEYVPM